MQKKVEDEVLLPGISGGTGRDLVGHVVLLFDFNPTSNSSASTVLLTKALEILL